MENLRVLFIHYGEVLAVILALCYVLLAIRQNPLCWVASIGGASIYIVLFFKEQLYMESLLQTFYVGMACYGLWVWRVKRTGQSQVDSEQQKPLISHTIQISKRSLKWHAMAIVGIFVITLGLVQILKEYVTSDQLLLDSLTTLASLFTTWMVAKKIAENWLYWVVINGVYVYLFWQTSLYLTAGLYLVFLGLALYGYRHWYQQIEEPKEV